MEPEVQAESTVVEENAFPVPAAQQEETPTPAVASSSIPMRESTPIEEIEEIPRVPSLVRREEPLMVEGDFHIGYYNPDDRAEPPTEFDLVYHEAEAEDNIQELCNLMKRASEYTEVSDSSRKPNNNCIVGVLLLICYSIL